MVVAPIAAFGITQSRQPLVHHKPVSLPVITITVSEHPGIRKCHSVKFLLWSTDARSLIPCVVRVSSLCCSSFQVPDEQGLARGCGAVRNKA